MNRNRIMMVFVLVVVAAVSAALLGGVYNLTQPKVLLNREMKLKTTILGAFGIPYDPDNVEQVRELFKNSIETKTVEGITFYRDYAIENGKKVYKGIALELSGSGFWAPIKMLIVLEDDMETIRAVKILEQAETPGLGGRMSEPWFTAQFKGKKIKPTFHVVSYRKANGPNEVDGITGATETSKAVDRILNEGTKKFFSIVKNL